MQLYFPGPRTFWPLESSTYFIFKLEHSVEAFSPKIFEQAFRIASWKLAFVKLVPIGFPSRGHISTKTARFLNRTIFILILK